MNELFKKICQVYRNSNAVENGFKILKNENQEFYLIDLSHSKLHNLKNDGPFLSPSKPNPIIREKEKDLIRKIEKLAKEGFIDVYEKRFSNDECPKNEITFFIKGTVTSMGVEADRAGGISNFNKNKSNFNAQGFYYKSINLEKIIQWILILGLVVYQFFK